jgi:ATP-dependent protease HslVU (ClpYQ) ATPase subunit
MSMTPREIVEELDKYIIGQHDAKRAVAMRCATAGAAQQIRSRCAARSRRRTS